MKELEKFGVQELSISEQQTTEGGLFIIMTTLLVGAAALYLANKL